MAHSQEFIAHSHDKHSSKLWNSTGSGPASGPPVHPRRPARAMQKPRNAARMPPRQPPACRVWAWPQPSGMPNADRLNATAADHRDGHTKGPFRGIRATLKPVPPMVPGKCRTRMPRHGALGAESRTTSRTPYIGRFCGRPDYLMPAAPFRPKEIVHGPRHSPACATPPPKHRRHILQAPGQPPDQAPAPSSPAA